MILYLPNIIFKTMKNEDIKGLLTEEIVKTEAIIKTYQELTKPVAPEWPLVVFQEWMPLTTKVLQNLP